MKVMIVEDLNIIRKRLVEAIVRIPNIEVVWQGHHEKIVEAVQETQPDVVVLDIAVQQPLQTRKALETVKSIKQLPSPPIVIMLGDAEYPGFERGARNWGVDLFLDRHHEIMKVPILLEEIMQNRFH